MAFDKLFTIILCAVGATLCCLSCVGSPPMIVDVKYAVAESFNKDTEFMSERLNIFVKVVEEDGFDDIDALYIIGDENMVYWTLNPQSWSVVEDEDGIWVGSDSLANPDSLFINGGLYRIEVYDKAGERDQYVIELDNQRLSGGENFTSSIQYSSAEDVLLIESMFKYNDVQLIINEESFVAPFDNGVGLPVTNLQLARPFSEYRGNVQIYLFSYDDTIPLSYIVLGPFRYDDILKENLDDEST